jgi:Zn-dependent membrane protease YugP
MLELDLLKEAILLGQNKSEKEIHDYFIAKGCSAEEVGVIMQEVKKYHLLKRRKRGIQILATGCCFLLLGFLITVVLFHKGGGFDLIMYSFSIVGITCLLWGMVDFLGW